MAQPSLLSTVQSSLKSQAQPQGPQSQTAQAQSLMSTAQTGKAQSPGSTTPALSNLAEKAQAIQTQQSQNQLLTQVQQEQTKVDQKAAAQAQTFAAQTQELDTKRLAVRQQWQTQLKGMLQQNQEALQGLSQQDTRSREEQIGALARLSNDKYITNLTQAAEKARLEDSYNFSTQLAHQVFDDERELLESNLDFISIFNMEHRDAMRQVSQMDLDQALAMARAGSKAAGVAAMASGASQVVGAGAKYWAESADKSSASTGTAPETKEASTNTQNYSKLSNVS